jgi:argininosuccinate synthase
MEPIKTANGQYEYTKQLNILVQKAHKYNCDENKWCVSSETGSIASAFYTPLKKGAFGYDNLIVSSEKHSFSDSISSFFL